MRALVLFVLWLCGVQGLKYVVYIPVFGRSHITFMGRLVDILVEEKHEVHVIMPVIEAHLGGYGSDKAHKVFTIPQAPSSLHFEQTAHRSMVHGMWRNSDKMTQLKGGLTFRDAWAGQCNATLHHPGLMEELRKENYDAGITEIMDFCSYGIFHHLGIERVAGTLTIGFSDLLFRLGGAPTFPSYVPNSLAQVGDRMTFMERVQNTLPYFFQPILGSFFLTPTDDIFRARFGNDFPNVEELMKNTSLVFLNNEPLIDFPRPTSHKVINIGGLSVSGGHKPLDEKWSSILDRRPYNVFISFGSVAKSHLMPVEYKETIRETVRKFPNVTFIWKYEKPEDGMSEGMDNLVETTWAPQNDLLYDARLSLFVSHGGQGSITEATTAGVPLIVVPVLFDQFRNGAIIRRIGSGISLEKEDLARPHILEQTFREVLFRPEYKEKARFTGEMIRNRPFSPRESFVKNVEFLAKYGPLTSQLNHFSLHLNIFQYYILDVIAFLLCIGISTIFALIFTLRLLIRKCLWSEKTKYD